MKTRREIGSLGADQLRDFRDAWGRMESTPEFQKLAGVHGLPNDDSTPSCPHGTPQFLPWHRLYTVEVERLLETHGFAEELENTGRDPSCVASVGDVVE